MKYQTLRLIASSLKVLAWIVVAIGILSSVRLGIMATTLVSSISFLLVGFLFTAICTLVLLAYSKFIYLFIDIEEDLSEIAGLLRKEPRNY